MLVINWCNFNFEEPSKIRFEMRRHFGHLFGKKSISIKMNDPSTCGRSTCVGKRRFQYDFCIEQFSNKSNLKVHRRTHFGEKPYSCDVNDKSFTQNGSLKAHQRGRKWTRFSIDNPKGLVYQWLGKSRVQVISM